MTSMPMPIPTPSQKSTMPTKAPPSHQEDRYKAERTASKSTKQASETKSRDTTETKEKESASSSPESFLSYMLAGLMGSQNFAATAPVAQDREPIAVPVSFGGTFNMDPSMLVLPDGVDAASLFLNADSNTSFSAELLAALTPGVPTDVAAIGVVDGEAVVQLEGDPRLIATGLDPAQMQALVARLANMASQQAASGAVPVQGNVATVSFLPVSDATDDLAAALLKPTTVQAPADGEIICFAPVAADDGVAAPVAKVTVPAAAASLLPADTKDDSALQAAVSVDIQVADDGGDFDPLEFRLAAKSSSYRSDPYAASDDTPALSAPPKLPPVVTPHPGQVTKGSMQPAGDTTTPPIAALPGDTLDSGSIKGFLDPLMPQIPAVSTTPLQTGSMAANPVLQNVTAAQSHPTTQAVAALINKTAQQGNGSQTLAVQLDPPELGKMQLKMRYEKGEPLRVHVVLEKADTMAMFQRDAHALENALNQAGLKTDSSSLTFDLGSQGSFGQAMNDQSGGSSREGQSGWTADSSLAVDDVVDTRLSIQIDPETGLAHYNMVV